MAMGDAYSGALGAAHKRIAADVQSRRVGTTRSGSPERIDGTAMAVSVGNRAWRPSTPDQIDADLTALWREVAREAPVSRAVMSNLVVFCRCAAGDDVDLASPPEGVPVDEVARNHPAHVIVLHHDPDAPGENVENAAPGTALAAH